MSNIELHRDHTGSMHLLVAGQFAMGAVVTGISKNVENENCAVVVIPLKHVVFGEVHNVVPFVPAHQ